MKQKLLVTGAGGFIGKETIPFLLDEGYEVHAISQKRGDDRVISHPCNLLNPQETAALLEKVAPTHLLHLAWITSPEVYLTSPLNLDWVEASIRLVRLFVQNGGKKVVISGSCAEYESAPLCIEDETPFRPSTFYAECKRNLYLILEKASRALGFELGWGYLFHLYGPHEKQNRFLPTVIRGILQKKEVLLTEGVQIRDFLHVRDAARALALLLRDRVHGCFNIASGEGISIRRMVEIAAEKMGGSELLRFGARPLSPFDPPSIGARITKIQNAIPWSPTFTLEQGLSETIQWWRCQTV